MNGINKAIILGHVGQDPKIVNFANGGKVANFTIATTEKGYTTKSGVVIQDRTEWHNIVAQGSLAGVVEQYVKKGTPVYIEGKIRTRTYDDQSGQKHYVTEIYADNMQMLGSKNDNQNQTQQQPVQTTQQAQQQLAQSPYYGAQNQPSVATQNTHPTAADTAEADKLPF